MAHRDLKLRNLKFLVIGSYLLKVAQTSMGLVGLSIIHRPMHDVCMVQPKKDGHTIVLAFSFSGPNRDGLVRRACLIMCSCNRC